jgi:2,3-bisphosphoglycerate-dependent phosphoglycerate mutase
MSTFYLIRHAQADFSLDEQRPLSAGGQADAQRVAQLLGEYPVTRIYSSPFRRALQTITPLAKKLGLPVHIEPGLQERYLGQGPEHCDFRSMLEQAWRDPSYVYPGGESNAAAQQRGIAVIRRLIGGHSAEHLVLLTHGNLLILILHYYDRHINDAFWKRLTMPDVYTLCLNEDEVTIARLWH